MSDLLKTLEGLKTQTEVVPPPFRVSDYALFPKTMFKHHFFLIEAKGVSVERAKLLAEWMKEWGFSFQFIGPDTGLTDIKKDYSE